MRASSRSGRRRRPRDAPRAVNTHRAPQGFATFAHASHTFGRNESASSFPPSSAALELAPDREPEPLGAHARVAERARAVGIDDSPRRSRSPGWTSPGAKAYASPSSSVSVVDRSSHLRAAIGDRPAPLAGARRATGSGRTSGARLRSRERRARSSCGSRAPPAGATASGRERREAGASRSPRRSARSAARAGPRAGAPSRSAPRAPRSSLPATSRKGWSRGSKCSRRASSSAASAAVTSFFSTAPALPPRSARSRRRPRRAPRGGASRGASRASRSSSRSASSSGSSFFAHSAYSAFACGYQPESSSTMWKTCAVGESISVSATGGAASSCGGGGAGGRRRGRGDDEREGRRRRRRRTGCAREERERHERASGPPSRPHPRGELRPSRRLRSGRRSAWPRGALTRVLARSLPRPLRLGGVLRHPLVDPLGERRGDVDARVRAGDDADDQREREVLDDAGAPDEEREDAEHRRAAR